MLDVSEPGARFSDSASPSLSAPPPLVLSFSLSQKINIKKKFKVSYLTNPFINEFISRILHFVLPMSSSQRADAYRQTKLDTSTACNTGGTSRGASQNELESIHGGQDSSPGWGL